MFLRRVSHFGSEVKIDISNPTNLLSTCFLVLSLCSAQILLALFSRLYSIFKELIVLVWFYSLKSALLRIVYLRVWLIFVGRVCMLGCWVGLCRWRGGFL